MRCVVHLVFLCTILFYNLKIHQLENYFNEYTNPLMCNRINLCDYSVIGVTFDSSIIQWVIILTKLSTVINYLPPARRVLSINSFHVLTHLVLMAILRPRCYYNSIKRETREQNICVSCQRSFSPW